jgi:pimeloyl-ACP methyl ester carboxylesterase
MASHTSLSRLQLGGIPHVVRCLVAAVAMLPAVDAVLAQPNTAIASSGCASAASTRWVLLSGMIGGTSGMRHLEQRLQSKGYCVVVIDPYAQSVDSTDVSFAALARRVNATLITLNIRAAHVVGHAHGGGVALRLAAMFPDRVSALDLVDVGALPTTRTALMGKSLSLIPIIANVPGGRSLIRAKVLDGIRENSGNAEWLNVTSERNYVDPILKDVGRSTAMMQRLSRAQEPEPVATVIARLHMPVTVVLGAAPHATAPTEAHLQSLKAVRGCLRILRVKGAGHFVQEEAPDQLANLLDSQCVTRVAGIDQ